MIRQDSVNHVYERDIMPFFILEVSGPHIVTLSLLCVPFHLKIYPLPWFLIRCQSEETKALYFLPQISHQSVIPSFSLNLPIPSHTYPSFSDLMANILFCCIYNVIWYNNILIMWHHITYTPLNTTNYNFDYKMTHLYFKGVVKRYDTNQIALVAF